MAVEYSLRDEFQSTLPGWGATSEAEALRDELGISIHAPRMGSDQSHHGGLRPGTYFNPRSPDGERRCVGSCSTGRGDFNPRSPDGERHVLQHADQRMRVISIHAPRMGSDLSVSMSVPETSDFNPRSPDGERPGHDSHEASMSLFQSTLPGWGATAKMDIFAHDMGKIIHFQH